MVVLLLTMVALVGVTGWLYTTGRFWGVAWVEELHETLSDILFGFVALHILGVVFTSFRGKICPGRCCMRASARKTRAAEAAASSSPSPARRCRPCRRPTYGGRGLVRR